MGGSRSRESSGFKNNNLHSCWESIPDSRVIWSLVWSLYELSCPALNLLARSIPHETIRFLWQLLANIFYVYDDTALWLVSRRPGEPGVIAFVIINVNILAVRHVLSH